MRLWSSLTSLWRNLFHKDEIEKDLGDEVRAYLELSIDKRVQEGVPPAEARRAALMELGGVDQVKENVRDVRMGQTVEQLWQDVRFGARLLIRRPGFTVVAVLTLALGIGANTAIFTLINAALLRSLPYEDADQIVVVASTMRRDRVEVRSTSYPDFLDWRNQNHVFEYLAARKSTSFTLTGAEEPERVFGELVSAEYFPLLRVRAALGRTFLPEEDRTPDTHRVAVLGQGLWQRRYGGRTDVIGQTIEVNAASYTVVGVMPEGFNGISDDAELWLPVVMISATRSVDDLQVRDQRWHEVIARLKPGVTVNQAQSEMDRVASGLEQTYPDTNRSRGVLVTKLHERIFGQLQLSLWILFAAVGFVLLVACANVANLQLQRAAGRTPEMAVRLALGATPRRLIFQLLTESLLLSVIGGAIGVVIALWSVRLLVKLSPVTLPSFVKLTLDTRVLLFSLLLSVVTGVVFGLVPALQASSSALNDTIKAGSRNSSSGGRRNRLLSTLVVSEIALALTLLIGAGLMIRSLQHLQAIDPGFSTEHLLTMRTSPPINKYKTEQIVTLTEQLRERIQQIPGAESVAISSDLPLSGSTSAGPIEIEGRPWSPTEELRMFRHRVTPGFFATLGIPIIKGRDFNAADSDQAPTAVVISQSMAQRHWPNEDPIGKRFREDSHDEATPEPWLSVVGVVGEVKYRGFPANPNADPDVYYSWRQSPGRDLNMAVRFSGDPDVLATAVRSALHQLDPNLPVYSVTTMSERVKEQSKQSRFSARILGLFAILALVLAAVGIYGVMSYAVEQRSHEIGIRIALGARTVDVLGMIIGHGMRLALIGVVVGLGATLALTRFMRQLLFGLAPIDPLTYGFISVLLSLVVLFACWLPARRATKVDPILALRCD